MFVVLKGGKEVIIHANSFKVARHLLFGHLEQTEMQIVMQCDNEQILHPATYGTYMAKPKAQTKSVERELTLYTIYDESKVK